MMSKLTPPRAMRHLALSLTLGLLLAAGSTHACMSDRGFETIPVYNMLGESLSTTGTQPEQLDLVIGSILNLAVPKGSRITVKALAKGSSEPVEPLADESYQRIPRIRFSVRESFSGTTKLDAYDVHHLVVNSYGKSQIEIQTATGTRHLIVGAVYEPHLPRGKPIPLPVASGDEPPVFRGTARGVGLWFKIPGKVGDGWQLEQDKENQFAILRIEQLNLPYNDPEAVGIFVHGAGAIRPGKLALISGQGVFSRKTYPFRIELQPVPKC